jgi:hypothetical protein
MKRKMTRHHVIPRSRGGSECNKNVLRLWNDKHECWHTLFSNKTIPEIIALLKRLQKLKGKRR